MQSLQTLHSPNILESLKGSMFPCDYSMMEHCHGAFLELTNQNVIRGFVKATTNTIKQKSLGELQEGYVLAGLLCLSHLFSQTWLCCRHIDTSTRVQPHTHTRTRHIAHAKGKGPGYAQLALGYCLATSAGCTRQPLLMEEVS